MRVTSISLYSNDEEAIRFDLQTASSKSQYVIRNIVGIDAEELTPRFYGFSKDGTQRYYDFKLKPREIVMRIALNPRYNLNEDVSSIRDEIYRSISATRTGEIKIQFHSGAATIAETYGHIVKMEVAHFSQIPEVQITLRCNDPMLRAIAPVIFGPSDLPSAANPVILADNASTAPHGLNFSIVLTSNKTSLTIQDKVSSPDWDFVITPATTFLTGDIIYFSSEFNNKYLYMDRSGAITHLMDKVNPNSRWPVIFPGFNEFYFVDLAQFDWIELSYTPAYWGV